MPPWNSLAGFLSRHGLTLEQLKSFNPGLEISDLTIGRVVRVAEAAPGQSLLAIRPLTSGGASWPDTPGFAPVRQTTPLTVPDTYMWPTKGVFTSGYGWRWGRMHKGIDIANNTGTPIHAARKGVVTYSGWSGAYGYLVEIAHADGGQPLCPQQPSSGQKRSGCSTWNENLTDGQHRSQHRSPSSLRDPSPRRCCCQSSWQTPPADSLI